MPWLIKRAKGRGRWTATFTGHRPLVKITGTVNQGEPVITEIALGRDNEARLTDFYPPGDLQKGLNQASSILPTGAIDILFDQLREQNPGGYGGHEFRGFTLPPDVLKIVDNLPSNDRSRLVAEAIRKHLG